MTTYRQLTEIQRCQIETLKKIGMKQNKIAEVIGVDPATISRELKRNKGERGYRHQQAQRKALERRQNAEKARKMTDDMVALVEEKLREEWSPEQVSGWMEKTQDESVSHERIYQHVWEDKRCGGDLYTHLRHQGKKYQKRSAAKGSRGQIKNRVSIDKRPAIVDSKTRVGDWEMDLVIGKGHSGALLTIVERKTLFTLSALIEGKHADVVTMTALSLLLPYKDRVHTITVDNGKEFAMHELIAEELDAKVFFAHPYSSWERGLNENTNGLLRQYFPKKMAFDEVTQEMVDEAVNKLNNRPRKTLDFDAPAKRMAKSLSLLAA